MKKFVSYAKNVLSQNKDISCLHVSAAELMEHATDLIICTLEQVKVKGILHIN